MVLLGMPRHANSTSFTPGHKRSPESIEKQRQTMRDQLLDGTRKPPPGYKGPKPPVRNKVCEHCGESYLPTGTKQRWCTACVPDFNKSRLMWRYCISWPEYLQMIEDQKGACPLCLRELTPDVNPCVDHKHGCGHEGKGKTCCRACVRGILCAGCNARLHAVDNTEWLLRAFKYVGSDYRSVFE